MAQEKKYALDKERQQD